MFCRDLECPSVDLERILRAVRRAPGVVPQLAGQRVPRQRRSRVLHEPAAIRQVYARSARLRTANARATPVLASRCCRGEVAHRRLPSSTPVHPQRFHPVEHLGRISEPSTAGRSTTPSRQLPVFLVSANIWYGKTSEAYFLRIKVLQYVLKY